MKLAQLKGLVDTVNQFKTINDMNSGYHHLCSEDNNNFSLYSDLDQNFGGQRFWNYENHLPNEQRVTHEFLNKLSEILGTDPKNDDFTLFDNPVLFTPKNIDFPGYLVCQKPLKNKIHELAIDRLNQDHVDIIYGYGRLSFFKIKQHSLSGMYPRLCGLKFFIMDNFVEFARISNTQEIDVDSVPDFEELSEKQLSTVLGNLHFFSKRYKNVRFPQWYQNFEIMR